MVTVYAREACLLAAALQMDGLADIHKQVCKGGLLQWIYSTILPGSHLSNQDTLTVLDQGSPLILCHSPTLTTSSPLVWYGLGGTYVTTESCLSWEVSSAAAPPPLLFWISWSRTDFDLRRSEECESRIR